MIVRGFASTAHINNYDYAIAPDAFARFIEAIVAAELPFLLRHDPAKRAGRILRLTQCDEGLRIEAEIDPSLPGTRRHIDLIARGTPYGFSVGIDERKAFRKPCGTPYVYKATLREISLTPDPANPGAVLESFSIPAPRKSPWPADLQAVLDEQAAWPKPKPFIPEIRYPEETTP